MLLMKKMFLATKGVVVESAEKTLEKRNVKILKQQLRELEHKQESILRNLIDARSCSKLQAVELEELRSKRSEYEDYIKKCFTHNKEALAREIAEQIYKMQPEITAREKTQQAFNSSLHSLELGRKQMLCKLNAVKQELALLELDKMVNTTVASIHSTKLDVTKVSFHEVTRSIDEVRKANQLESLRLIEEQKILEEESSDLLEEKLKDNGILHEPHFYVDEILTLIREKVVVNG